MYVPVEQFQVYSLPYLSQQQKDAHLYYCSQEQVYRCQVQVHCCQVQVYCCQVQVPPELYFVSVDDVKHCKDPEFPSLQNKGSEIKINF